VTLKIVAPAMKNDLGESMRKEATLCFAEMTRLPKNPKNKNPAARCRSLRIMNVSWDDCKQCKRYPNMRAPEERDGNTDDPKKPP
jgi:hypothetical protein